MYLNNSVLSDCLPYINSKRQSPGVVVVDEPEEVDVVGGGGGIVVVIVGFIVVVDGSIAGFGKLGHPVIFFVKEGVVVKITDGKKKEYERY